MKTLLTTAILLASIATVQAQTQTHKLTITISNIMERTGTIHLGLVTKAEQFMDQTADTDTVVAVPASGPMVIALTMPTGTYAVRLYQDVNGDKQMNRDNGMPTEPFGFSNIVMLMGPPSFEAASFALTADTEMKMVLLRL